MSFALEHLDACPVCGSADREVEHPVLTDCSFGAAPGEWTMYRCGDCGAAFLDPRPDRATILHAYAGYYTHAPAGPPTARKRVATLFRHALINHATGARLRPAMPLGWLPFVASRKLVHDHRQLARGLGRVARGSSRVLDVGCGNGAFLGIAASLGWTAEGVEFDAAAGDATRLRGATVVGERVDTLSPRFDERYDVVTMSHVIEHLHDPVEVLRHCRRVLKLGGRLWIETPNADAFGHREFGRWWRGLECPRHLVLFNRRALDRALRLAGFGPAEPQPQTDAAPYVLERSGLSEAGRISEKDSAPVPLPVRRRAGEALARYRTIVQKNPELLEYLTVAATKVDNM